MHIPVAVPRHQTGPPRWHHRHGTSRLSTSPAGQSASSAPSPIRAPNSRPPSRSGNAGEVAGPSRKRSKAHEMARRVRDRHRLARQTPPERPMPRFEVPPCAGRLPVRPDNRAVRKNVPEVGVIRQRIENASKNASPRKAPKPPEDAVPLPVTRACFPLSID